MQEKTGVWLVTTEYNDDEEPYMAYRSLKAVRKAIHAGRLTKRNNNYYTYVTYAKKTYLIMNIDGLIELYGSEAKALAEIQRYGIVDEEQREPHFMSIGHTWDPAVGTWKQYRNNNPLLVHLVEKDDNSIMTAANYLPIEMHQKRLNEVLGVKKPTTIKQVREILA